MSGGPLEAATLYAMATAPEIAATTAAATAAAAAVPTAVEGAGLAGNAFGSADMLASLAPKTGLLGESSAIPGLFGENMGQMADGSIGQTIEATGMTPNSYGGYDSLNPLQRGWQRLNSGDMKMPRMPNLTRPASQQQAAAQSPARFRAPAQEQQPTQPLYGGNNAGVTQEDLLRYLLQLKGQA